MRPAQKRSAAEELIEDYRASVVRVCKLIMLHRSLWYYKPSGRDDTVIRMRMREIALTRVRYGCRRISILLRREGWRDNHKRIHRLYCLEGLNLRTKMSQMLKKCELIYNARKSYKQNPTKLPGSLFILTDKVCL